MASPHGVASLLRGRRGDVAYHKFKPENYHEINRVLGQRFAPAEINRVVSKHRADAASAYLRRLHRDVERSQKGFYQTLSVLPLQVKRLSVMKEDQRSFKSLLIPKRPPLANPQPSPRSDDSSYPRDVPPQVVQDGSNYVPHKFFSPHTHIHVLFKQMPQTGSVTPRKGGPNASVTSGGSSPVSLGGSSKTPRLGKPLPKAATKLSPREGALSRSPDADPVWPQEHHAQPYTYPKFAASHAPLPHIKKRVSPVDKSYVRPERHVQLPGKSWADVAPTHNAVGSGGNAADGLPASVAAALAAGNASEALYRMDLPPDLAAAYDKNLPSERAKAVVVGNRGRFPAPSFPSRVQTDKLLAIVSVERSNAVQVAA